MPQMPKIPTSIRGKLAWNTATQLIARGVSAIVTFVITLVIARKFGVDGFGDFVKITTYIAFFYLLADFGFNAIYLQRTAPVPLAGQQDKASAADTSWENLLVLRLIVSSVLVVFANIILYLMPQGNVQGYTQLVRLGILFFAPSIVFQALTSTANALFQKYLRYDLSMIAVVIGSLSSLVLILFVTIAPFVAKSVLWATTSILIGAAMTAAVSLYLTRRLQKITRTRIDWTQIRSLFFASLPLGITLLFNLVYFRVDSIILTLTRTTAEVGIYGLAYKVFELPLVIPTFFMNALYPVMLKTGGNAFGAKTDDWKKLLRKSSGMLLVASLILLVLFWAAAPLLTIIKSDFAPSVPALRILVLGLPFFFLSSLTMWTLIAKRQQKLLALLYGVSMIINVSLNLLFIPQFGYTAAAWITVISEGIVFFLSGAFVFRQVYL